MSTPSTVPQTLVIPPDAGEMIRAFGDAAQVKLDASHTGGNLTLVLDTTPPSGGPPPHRHSQEDEIFIIVDPGLRFFANGAWTEPLEPGSVVYAQRGAIHTFHNTSDKPARHWIFVTPSGFETFFAKCAVLFATPDAPPDMPRIVEISTEHGIEYVPPLL